VQANGGTWPPKGLTVFNPWGVPFLNTLILLTSGVTLTWAHHELREGNRKAFLQGLGLTILLGICFTSLQAYEYASAPFHFRAIVDGEVVKGGSVYTSTFFMATGFHGFHVIVGTLFLIVCFFRGTRGHFKPDHHFGFEAAAWYWHFVDVVWLFLFSCVYWWGSGNAPVH
jgi:cytochrome c oxidase subunit 3